MIEFLKSFLFGIVEGITEWLPISSTGHLILLNQFVKLDVSEEFYSMFEVVIQLGAILAVVILFWNQIFPFGAQGGSRTVRRRQAKHAHRKKEIRKWNFKLCEDGYHYPLAESPCCMYPCDRDRNAVQ